MPKSFEVRSLKKRAAGDVAPQQAHATDDVRPHAAASLPANRYAQHQISHERRHVAVAEREVAGARRVLEEIRRPAPVELEPGDTVAHPAERCTQVDPTFDFILEVVVAAMKLALPPKFPPMNGVMYQSADARLGAAAKASTASIETRSSLRTIMYSSSYERLTWT